MQIRDFGFPSLRLKAPLPIWRATVDADAWSTAAELVAKAGGRLVSLWGSDASSDAGQKLSVAAAYAVTEGLLWVELPLERGDLLRAGE